MSDAEHKENVKAGEFCADKRSGECDCGNDYVEVCEPRSPRWGSLKYAQRFKDSARERSHEAHHILCVAQVIKVVLGRSKPDNYLKILEATVWCINQKKNMIALPMWGHTIEWYCFAFSSEPPGNQGYLSVSNLLQRVNQSGSLPRPPFRNLPQHNYGHSGPTVSASYNREVEDKLNKLINSLEKDKEKHFNERVDALKSKLLNLSGDLRSDLQSRGKREHGGTHAAWQAGIKDPTPQSKWYMPFSMAEEPRPISFPTGKFDDEMSGRIRALANALWKVAK